jgi:hypothetical protein
LSSIEQQYSAGGELSLSIGEWTESVHIILDGQPFSFKRHEYLREPYRDDHPHIVEMKAAQMGITTKAMLRALLLRIIQIQSVSGLRTPTQRVSNRSGTVFSISVVCRLG